MIPIEEQAEVKKRWPDPDGHAGRGLTPNQGLSETLERMTMFGEKYQISGLKLYTFDSPKKRGWCSTIRSRRTDVGEGEEAGPQEHRVSQGNPVRTVHGPLRHPEDPTRCATTSGSQLHRLSLGVAYQHELPR